ncbi:MAG: HEPN family nuclease [Bacteroidales bacterium]|nr:HEPN family nuclease [Bacteroidales bacterium]
MTWEFLKGKYDTELISRTKKLIETYDGKYNLTLLMNGILSLIVLPQQHNSRIRKLKFMNRDLKDIEEIQFVLNSPNFYFDKRNFNNDLKNFLNRVRNGIAHQRIGSISENNKWKGVIIQDVDRHNNLGLNMELRTSELRSLAFYIADEYLIEIKNASR